jgi:hypothetical protein
MDYKRAKKTGVVELNQDDLNDPGTMKVVHNLLNRQQGQWVEEIQSIENTYNLDYSYAMGVWYLRTRSRWTQALEDRLIQMYREGKPCPNMNEYGTEYNY